LFAALTPGAARGAAPHPDAAAWIVVDPADGRVLASHRARAQLPIASTTKLMTAYLALRNLRPGERLTAPAYHAKRAESVLGLHAGESDTVHDLLYGLLLPSGNDAAVDLADGVAGSVPAFVARMNRAAAHLGLRHTSYSTPVGLDDPANFSSARDLVTLAGILMRNPLFRRIVDTPQATLSDGAVVRHVDNTNLLLSRAPFIDGVKTGSTDNAGEVLVSSGTRQGVTLVAALLGAPDEAARDDGSLALLRYGFSRYSARVAVRRGEILRRVPARFSADSLPLAADRTVRVYSRDDQRLGVRSQGPRRALGPIPAGTTLGHASVSLEGRRQGRLRLVAASRLPAPVDPGAIERALPGSIGSGLAQWLGALVLAGGFALGGLAIVAGGGRR